MGSDAAQETYLTTNSLEFSSLRVRRRRLLVVSAEADVEEETSKGLRKSLEVPKGRQRAPRARRETGCPESGKVVLPRCWRRGGLLLEWALAYKKEFE